LIASLINVLGLNNLFGFTFGFGIGIGFSLISSGRILISGRLAYCFIFFILKSLEDLAGEVDGISFVISLFFSALGGPDPRRF
jgi:hypothetical protein